MRCVLELAPSVHAVRVDAWSLQQTSWCEVWIDGELCDREDEGRVLLLTGEGRWSGTPNNDDRRKTFIR
jgi:hypothetical protein